MFQDERLKRVYEDIKDYCNDTDIDVVKRLASVQDVILYSVQASKGLELEISVEKARKE